MSFWDVGEVGSEKLVVVRSVSSVDEISPGGSVFAGNRGDNLPVSWGSGVEDVLGLQIWLIEHWHDSVSPVWFGLGIKILTSIDIGVGLDSVTIIVVSVSESDVKNIDSFNVQMFLVKVDSSVFGLGFSNVSVEDDIVDGVSRVVNKDVVGVVKSEFDSDETRVGFSGSEIDEDSVDEVALNGSGSSFGFDLC